MLRLEDVGRVETLARVGATLRALLAGGSMRFESGAEGRVAWLDAPAAIPVYLAGSGPRMLRTAGEHGDGAILYASVMPDILRAGLDRVAEGARASGRTPGELDVALWAPASVHRDRAVARDHVRGRVASALRHPLPVPLAPEDQAAVERVRREYDAYQHATAAARHRSLVPDRLVDMMALAGTPEEVREQVERLRSVPEIRRLIVFPQAPGAASGGREGLLRLFAEEVMARVA